MLASLWSTQNDQQGKSIQRQRLCGYAGKGEKAVLHWFYEESIGVRETKIKGGSKMKVRYIGDYYKVRLHKGSVYNVISIENGWYEIMGEDGDQGFFPSGDFEIVEP